MRRRQHPGTPRWTTGLALAIALGVGGCVGAAADAPGGDEGAAFGQTAQGITLSECTEDAIRAAAPHNALPFLDRALNWVHRGAPYSQNPQSAFGGYRTDCSGLVSMSWGLPAPGESTSTLGGGAYDDGISVRLHSWNDIAIGDATNHPASPGEEFGHVRLFAGWMNAAHTSYCSIEEYDYGHPASIRVHTLDTSSYLPIRLRSWTPAPLTWGATLTQRSTPDTTPVRIRAGEATTVWFELRNAGQMTWDLHTRIGTTGPRDRTSVFAGDDWTSGTRPVTVGEAVPPGGTYRFSFTLQVPPGQAPGHYVEHWGLLEEDVAWFGSDGQQGPADDALTTEIEVLPGAEADAATSDGGTVGDGSAADDARAPTHDAGTVVHDGSASDGGTGDVPPGAVACNVSRGVGHGSRGGAGVVAVMALGMLVARRRRGRAA